MWLKRKSRRFIQLVYRWGISPKEKKTTPNKTILNHIIYYEEEDGTPQIRMRVRDYYMYAQSEREML